MQNTDEFLQYFHANHVSVIDCVALCTDSQMFLLFFGSSQIMLENMIIRFCSWSSIKVKEKHTKWAILKLLFEKLKRKAFSVVILDIWTPFKCIYVKTIACFLDTSNLINGLQQMQSKVHPQTLRPLILQIDTSRFSTL